MTEKHDEQDRAQLDGRFQIYFIGALTAYLVFLLVYAEAGFAVPAWLPEWAPLVPFLAVFWWVPLLLYLAMATAYRKLAAIG